RRRRAPVASRVRRGRARAVPRARRLERPRVADAALSAVARRGRGRLVHPLRALMHSAPIILPSILVVALVLQAIWPRYRLLIVLGGAGATCLATSVLGLGHAAQILADVPWDVLVILVGLGLVSEVF